MIMQHLFKSAILIIKITIWSEASNYIVPSQIHPNDHIELMIRTFGEGTI